MSCGTREACASLRDRQKLLDPEQLLRAQVPYLKWPTRAAGTGAGFINIQHGFSPYFPMKYRGFLWFPVNFPFQSSEPTQNHHEKTGLASPRRCFKSSKGNRRPQKQSFWRLDLGDSWFWVPTYGCWKTATRCFMMFWRSCATSSFFCMIMQERLHFWGEHMKCWR